MNNNNWLYSLSFLLIVIKNREPLVLSFSSLNSLHLVTNLPFKLNFGMIVETVFLIQLDHKRREMIHEKDASIAGECACFNSLRSAEKRCERGNRKQNGAKHKGFLVC